MGPFPKVYAVDAWELKALHALPVEGFGWCCREDRRAGSWLAFCQAEFDSAREERQGFQHPIPETILQAVVVYFETHQDCLQGGAPVLCHADLWPGNILVEEDRLSGSLDLEFAKQAPPDEELLLIEEFCLYPND